jgi:hypothetical protein
MPKLSAKESPPAQTTHHNGASNLIDRNFYLLPQANPLISQGQFS